VVAQAPAARTSAAQAPIKDFEWVMSAAPIAFRRGQRAPLPGGCKGPRPRFGALR
jgi:hypothetical protein